MKPISELSKTARVLTSTMQSLHVTTMLGVVLFVSAGSFDWVQAMIFVVVYGFCNLISSLLLFTEAPELLDARHKKNKEVRMTDKILELLYQTMYFPTLISGHAGAKNHLSPGIVKPLLPDITI